MKHNALGSQAGYPVPELNFVPGTFRALQTHLCLCIHDLRENLARLQTPDPSTLALICYKDLNNCSIS